MNASLQRKVVYLVIIAALLYPLSYLGQPPTAATPGRAETPGGKLAQLRSEGRLGQANLGKIDPTSATIKLATLGLGDLATPILWQRADECKRRTDWIGFKTALDQIAVLQPNYIGVWQFQAHNLAYNISAEWDDYRDRYYWVIKGIEFLQQGVELNQNEPKLLSDVAFTATHKIGQSDERVQFRRLFREDDDFHSKQRVQQRDNWLFGMEYYLEAQRVADLFGSTSLPMAPLMFHARPTIALTHYGDALVQDHGQAIRQAAMLAGQRRLSAAERERQFAEIDADYQRRIESAWEAAADSWQKYGNREFSSVVVTDGVFRLNDERSLAERFYKAVTSLDELAPGLRDKIDAERRAQLTPEMVAALEMLPGERDPDQARLAFQAETQLMVSFHDLAERIEAEQRELAEDWADEAFEYEQRLLEVRTNRIQANYDYWIRRCEMEQTKDAMQARRLLHRATAAFQVEADLNRAKQLYASCFEHWRKVLDAYPEMLTDQTAYTMRDAVDAYRAVLAQLDEQFPKNFILQDMIDVHQQGEIR